MFAVPNPPQRIESKRRILHRPTPEVVTPSLDEILHRSPPTTCSTATPPKSESPTKRKLRLSAKKFRAQVQRREKKIETMKSSSSSKKKKIEDIVSTISEFLPTETVSFIESQLNCADKKPKGRRWTFKDKSVALSIYFHSKRAYKVLGKIFKLPSKSTLSKILQGSGISPGISDKVMHALKIKANQMSIEDRQCVLLFDEMSLKYGLTYNPHGDFIEGFENYGNFGSTQHISNHALCFMVRGLKQKWKQPLAYFLSSNTTPSQTLKCITKSIITQLTDINLNVRVLICDQGSSNRSFLETNEHVNSTQPYFYVNNQKISVMYDPPHLLKSIRNNLCSTGFLLD